MDTKQIKCELAKELAELLTRKGITPTIENIAGALLDCGLVTNKQARRFLAVSEFYRRYEGRKTQIVEELAVKFSIGRRQMYELTNCRRYVV